MKRVAILSTEVMAEEAKMYVRIVFLHIVVLKTLPVSVQQVPKSNYLNHLSRPRLRRNLICLTSITTTRKYYVIFVNITLRQRDLQLSKDY